MEYIKIVIPLINAWILAYFWYQIWKRQEVLKNQKENWLKFLSLLKRYNLSIDNLRNWRFQIYNTEREIYQERWNQLLKIWIELQNEHTLTELLFPNKNEEITLTWLAELQNELKANLDTYIDRKSRNEWRWDRSDVEISKVIFKPDNTSDEFWEKIKNEIEKISNPIKTQLTKQFNTTF